MPHLKALLESFSESRKKLVVASSWGWPYSLNWNGNSFTKTHLEPFMTDILPVSNFSETECFRALFLGVKTLLYLNWPRNGHSSKFKIKKKCLKKVQFTSQIIIQTQFLKFDRLPFLGNWIVICLERKPCSMPFEEMFGNGRVSLKRGSSWVLVKVVLFSVKKVCPHSGWCHTQYLSWLRFCKNILDVTLIISKIAQSIKVTNITLKPIIWMASRYGIKNQIFEI